MPSNDGEIVFEPVDPSEAPSEEPAEPDARRADEGPVKDPADDALPTGLSPAKRRREIDADRFPLAGPIIEEAARELRGRCSSCDSRLRIRVRSHGTVRVRCPICGHASRIEV